MSRSKFTVLPSFASPTLDCPHPEISGWGRVMVNTRHNLCEVGKDCPATQCAYRWTDAQVKPCPTCKGEPNVSEPPYGCETCDVFGVVRK